jgi:hypothetical protein
MKADYINGISGWVGSEGVRLTSNVRGRLAGNTPQTALRRLALEIL